MPVTPSKIWEQFEAVSRTQPGNAALIHGETLLTYADLRQNCLASAESWRDLAPQAAKIRVLISQASPLDTLISILAAWRLDAAAAVLKPYGPQQSLAPYIRALQPELVVSDRGVSRTAGPAKSSKHKRALEECLILATSGTRSEPKLVALPASSIMLHALVMARDLGVSASDRFQASLPLSHAYGLVGGPMAALQHGATVLLYSPPLVPSIVQRDIREYGVTVVQGPASVHRLNFQFWNGKPFPSVRLVTQAGEYFGPALAAKVAAAYPSAQHVQIFGMTECGRISHRTINDPALASNEIGVPFSHIEWKILPGDPEGGSGSGLFAVRGPSVMLGYVKEDGAYFGLDEEGYFRSADIMAPSPGGGLRYLGRLDRCFKSGGKPVNPALIETLLMNQPGVAKALCGSEAHTILGEVPVVTVVLEEGSPMSVEDLKCLCARELQPQMVPSRIAVMSDLPLGAAGKTLMRASPDSDL